MTMELSRRDFLRTAGAGMAGTAIGAFGFGDLETAQAASIRAFKLIGTTETRNTCPYCSVACGIITYARGDLRKGEAAKLIHIEGDVDHPTNRGTLCPKGAALLDFVHSETRLTQPKIRRPGSDRFEPISWDQALDRIARLMKDDRDKNLVAQEQRWRHRQSLDDHRLPRRVRDDQRNGVPDLQGGPKRRHGGVRQPGAGLTRPDGVQFGPDIRPWRDDQLLDRHPEHRSRRHHGRQRR